MLHWPKGSTKLPLPRAMCSIPVVLHIFKQAHRPSFVVKPCRALACTIVVGIPRVAGVVADSFGSLSSRDHSHFIAFPVTFKNVTFNFFEICSTCNSEELLKTSKNYYFKSLDILAFFFQVCWMYRMWKKDASDLCPSSWDDLAIWVRHQYFI